ncbi:MAG: hypothetical protein ACE5GD_08910 [Candidatus Geothermarchaeales archaeon]
MVGGTRTGKKMIIKVFCRRCGRLIHLGSNAENLHRFEYCLRCQRILRRDTPLVTSTT